MSAEDRVDQNHLRDVLYYNKQFGIFVWKINIGRARIGNIAGKLDVNGYVKIGIKGAHYFAHRLAFLYVNGRFPEKHTDHINGIRTDNSFSNLRCVTRQENQRNQKKPITNTSGVVGVSWAKNRNKWESKIKVSGKTIHLGRHFSFFEAVCARKSAERLYSFHVNHGRSVC